MEFENSSNINSHVGRFEESNETGLMSLYNPKQSNLEISSSFPKKSSLVSAQETLREAFEREQNNEGNFTFAGSASQNQGPIHFTRENSGSSTPLGLGDQMHLSTFARVELQEEEEHETQETKKAITRQNASQNHSSIREYDDPTENSNGNGYLIENPRGVSFGEHWDQKTEERGTAEWHSGNQSPNRAKNETKDLYSDMKPNALLTKDALWLMEQKYRAQAEQELSTIQEELIERDEECQILKERIEILEMENSRHLSDLESKNHSMKMLSDELAEAHKSIGAFKKLPLSLFLLACELERLRFLNSEELKTQEELRGHFNDALDRESLLKENISKTNFEKGELTETIKKTTNLLANAEREASLLVLKNKELLEEIAHVKKTRNEETQKTQKELLTLKPIESQLAVAKMEIQQLKEQGIQLENELNRVLKEKKQWEEVRVQNEQLKQEIFKEKLEREILKEKQKKEETEQMKQWEIRAFTERSNFSERESNASRSRLPFEEVIQKKDSEIAQLREQNRLLKEQHLETMKNIEYLEKRLENCQNQLKNNGNSWVFEKSKEFDLQKHKEAEKVQFLEREIEKIQKENRFLKEVNLDLKNNGVILLQETEIIREKLEQKKRELTEESNCKRKLERESETLKRKLADFHQMEAESNTERRVKTERGKGPMGFYSQGLRVDPGMSDNGGNSLRRPSSSRSMSQDPEELQAIIRELVKENEMLKASLYNYEMKFQRM